LLHLFHRPYSLNAKAQNLPVPTLPTLISAKKITQAIGVLEGNPRIYFYLSSTATLRYQS
jgi:hypothetical protein